MIGVPPRVQEVSIGSFLGIFNNLVFQKRHYT